MRSVAYSEFLIVLDKAIIKKLAVVQTFIKENLFNFLGIINFEAKDLSTAPQHFDDMDILLELCDV